MLNADTPLLSKGRTIAGVPVAMTPTENCKRTNGVRPFSGRASTWRVVITCPVEASAVPSSGATASTVTLSVAPPTCSLTSITGWSPAANLRCEYS